MQAAKVGDLTELEWAIQTLVKNYDKYAGKAPILKKRHKLSKRNFQNMLSHELNHILTETKEKNAIQKMFHDLDENQDGKIDFNEYWSLVSEMIIRIILAKRRV